MMILSACSGTEETDYYPSSDISARLSVNQSNITVAAKSQDATIKVSSNVQWTATSDASWCTLTTASGVGNSDLIIKVSDNLSTEQRTCIVTVSAEGKTATLNVIQNGGSLPTVTISNISDVTRYTANISGSFSSDFSVTEIGVIYSITSNPQVDGEKLVAGTSGATGKIEKTISGLKSGTTYYVCTYATSALGTSYSEVKTFKTLGDKPGDDDNPTPSI